MKYEVKFQNDVKVYTIDENKKNEIEDFTGRGFLGKIQVGSKNEFITKIESIREIKETTPGRQMFDVSQYVKNKKPANRKKAIESMAKGLKNYIDSNRYKGTQAPFKLLDNFREVYKIIK